MKDCIGFGALNVDLIYEVERLSDIIIEGRPCEPGAEIFCAPKDFKRIKKVLDHQAVFKSQSPGGSAANTIVALSRMGFKTGYIGKVGQDEEGDFLLKSMHETDTSRVLRDGETGYTVVLIDKKRERTILVLPNANDELVFDDIDVEFCKLTKILHLTSFAGEDPTQAQIDLVKEIGKNVTVSFDPGEIHTQKGLTKMIPVIKHTDVLFVTDREARLLTGEDYVDGTRELLNYGPDIVVCKLGPEGSYLLSREHEFHTPPAEVVPIDRTGAGDVFAAGFIAGMLKEYDLMRCAKMATKAAAQSITGWGRTAYPNASLLTEGV